MMSSPPSRGAWIEIENVYNGMGQLVSPPSRGAWIEISALGTTLDRIKVAPLAGGVD